MKAGGHEDDWCVVVQGVQDNHVLRDHKIDAYSESVRMFGFFTACTIPLLGGLQQMHPEDL